MTIARAQMIDLNLTPYYHITTRCVRRSFLCGIDAKSGKNYSHRKEWLVTRFKRLASIFAIKICAYAVMSNHYHLVLAVNDSDAKSWSDAEIQMRWAKIFPSDAKKFDNQIKNGIGSPALYKLKLELWRERLTSISWFMRCLNEPIARDANLEDECSGRFWEGRFKSQALLDEAAVLSAMMYVDLNPIRAGQAESLEQSTFTSIQERIKYAAKKLQQNKKAIKQENNFPESLDNLKQPPDLLSFHKREISDQIPCINFSISEYFALTDATGRIIRGDKRGHIPPSVAPVLQKLNLDPEHLIFLIKRLEQDFSYFVGKEQVKRVFQKYQKAKSAEKIVA